MKKALHDTKLFNIEMKVNFGTFIPGAIFVPRCNADTWLPISSSRFIISYFIFYHVRQYDGRDSCRQS